MNVYDFDGTIYDGDSSLDFFKFFIKKDPRILTFTPAILKIIDDYRKTTLRFDDVIGKYGYVITDYVAKHNLLFAIALAMTQLFLSH